MTLEEARQVRAHQVIYEVGEYNVDGTTRRWRVNGRVKTWKRNPNRIQVPIKHGLYACDYLAEYNLAWFTIVEPEKRGV